MSVSRLYGVIVVFGVQSQIGSEDTDIGSGRVPGSKSALALSE